MTNPINGRVVEFTDAMHYGMDLTNAAIAVNRAAHLHRAFTLIVFDARGKLINLGEMEYAA